MKEQYIRQVEKELKVPRNRKREILRDLQEAFASALEHGETEAQVIQRLGTPKEFANSTAEQLGVDPVRGKKRKQLLAGLLCLVVAAAAFAGYAAGQLSHAGGCHRPGGRHDQYPGDRGLGIPVPGILLAAGILFACGALVFLLRAVGQNRGQR